MNSLQIRSNNKKIQKVLDGISRMRQRVIKEGSVSFYIYDRLFKRILLEVFRGNFRRATYLFRFRFLMLVRQGYKADPYLDWIITNEPSPYERKQQRAQVDAMPQKPLISIVTPVFKPPESVLTKMMDSVSSQIYPHWEHCLVNADANDGTTAGKLAVYAQKDKRICWKTLDRNLGISDNTNEAIRMAKGEWIAFLDHDDQLSPFALFEVVKAINEHPDFDVFYSDEDKIQVSDQRRFSPFFKPDFNVDSLNSLNYMAHFLVVRKSVGDAAGWLDSRYDGSQDYDLVLKLSEKTQKIYHIPKILYHWKTAEGSTAGSLGNKSYAVNAGERALNDHLQRCGQGEYAEPGSYPYQARYPIKGQPKISMIIANRDNSAGLKRLLGSVFEKSTYPKYEIVIVENGSHEQETFDYYETLKANSKVKIVEWNEPFNYSLVNNFGEEHATGDVILLLNNDMEVITPDWLERMLEHVLRPEIGAVGAKLYYPNDTIQHGGVIVGMFGLAGHAMKGYPRQSPGYYNRLISIQNYSALTAACLMVRRKVFHEVHGLDSALRLEFNDVDFCLKLLERGYRNLWTPYAELYHYESLTRGGYDTKEKKALNAHEISLFQARWADFLKKGDPCYNPNLSHTKEDFSFNLSD